MSRSMKKVPRTPDERGMSLMEVLVSLVVMGVILVGLGQALTLAIRMNTESKLRISNLNLCKRVTEKVKSQVEYNRAVFDSAETNNVFNTTFNADANGNPITAGPTAPSATYAVTCSVINWTDSAGNTLSAVDPNGVSNVLVKVLNVRVLAQASAISGMSASTATASPRETTLRVEMVRPSS